MKVSSNLDDSVLLWFCEYKNKKGRLMLWREDIWNLLPWDIKSMIQSYSRSHTDWPSLYSQNTFTYLQNHNSIIYKKYCHLHHTPHVAAESLVCPKDNSEIWILFSQFCWCSLMIKPLAMGTCSYYNNNRNLLAFKALW